jgi:hypothetical protein
MLLGVHVFACLFAPARVCELLCVLRALCGCPVFARMGAAVVAAGAAAASRYRQ